jgi:hypothetical protein
LREICERPVKLSDYCAGGSYGREGVGWDVEKT